MDIVPSFRHIVFPFKRIASCFLAGMVRCNSCFGLRPAFFITSVISLRFYRLYDRLTQPTVLSFETLLYRIGAFISAGNYLRVAVMSVHLVFSEDEFDDYFPDCFSLCLEQL